MSKSTMIKLSTLLKAKELTENLSHVKCAIEHLSSRASKAPKKTYDSYSGTYMIKNGANVYGYLPNQMVSVGVLALPDDVQRKMLESYLEGIKSELGDLGVEIDV